jgi:hypothetical protein
MSRKNIPGFSLEVFGSGRRVSKEIDSLREELNSQGEIK